MHRLMAAHNAETKSQMGTQPLTKQLLHPHQSSRKTEGRKIVKLGRGGEKGCKMCLILNKCVFWKYIAIAVTNTTRDVVGPLQNAKQQHRPLIPALRRQRPAGSTQRASDQPSETVSTNKQSPKINKRTEEGSGDPAPHCLTISYQQI